MSDSGNKPPEQPLTYQKARDRAFMLPLVGLILLIPPFADIFQLDTNVFGLPFTVLYLFAVWALLILGAAVLSRQLHEQEDYDRDDYDGGTDAGPD